MKNEIFEKVIPSYYVYYKEGIISNFDEMSDFIQKSGIECLKLNPNIKCVTPDYCFVNYLDNEYKDNNMRIRYSQAVIKNDTPFIENEEIKFMEIPEEKPEVSSDQHITREVKKEEEEIYLAFYKPRGIVCTTATEENGEKIQNIEKQDKKIAYFEKMT